MTGQSLTTSADHAVMAATRRAGTAHRRWTDRHPHHGLPAPAAAVWPRATAARAASVRGPANACRWIPARTWTARQRCRSTLGRAVLTVVFLLSLPAAAGLAVALVVAGLPVRLVRVAVDEVYIARGWARPGTTRARLAELEAERVTRLAEIRSAVPEPSSLAIRSMPPASGTGELPPWALGQPTTAHLTPPTTGPGQSPFYTAPHYVRAPPPAAAMRPGPSHRLSARGWGALFKTLVLAGFAYALCLACLITVAADHLNHNPTQSTPSEQTPP